MGMNWESNIERTWRSCRPQNCPSMYFNFFNWIQDQSANRHLHQSKIPPNFTTECCFKICRPPPSQSNQRKSEFRTDGTRKWRRTRLHVSFALKVQKSASVLPSWRSLGGTSNRLPTWMKLNSMAIQLDPHQHNLTQRCWPLPNFYQRSNELPKLRSPSVRALEALSKLSEECWG